jgi:hypothetical protein
VLLSTNQGILSIRFEAAQIVPPFACFLSLFYDTRFVLVAPTQLLPFLFIPMSGSA